MKIDYRLPESVITVQGTVERVRDRISNIIDPSKRVDEIPWDIDWSERTVDVLLGARADDDLGRRTLTLEGPGDNEFAIELTSDRRLTGVSFKSVGVGSRVLGATATVVASVLGVIVRMAPMLAALSLDTSADTSESDIEEKARKKWAGTHDKEHAHRTAYVEILDAATARLRVARKAIATSASPQEEAATVSTVYRLETVATAAQREIQKVDALYEIWRGKARDKRTENHSYSVSINGLPHHGPDDTPPDPSTLTGDNILVWTKLGIIVEIGPVAGQESHRPPEQPMPPVNERQVEWRVPHLVRLWVWTRDEDGRPVLQKSFEAPVVEVFSPLRAFPLDQRVFGESGGGLVFDVNGNPTKVVRNDKSAIGALADALAGVPAAIASGLDSATKITGSIDALRDAGSERRLESLKRQVDTRKNELELKGIDATASDFAELKRLTQDVELAKARTTLADPSELSRMQNDLALATAQRDLEAIVRQRALDGELAGAQTEIARLKTELELAEARAKRPR